MSGLKARSIQGINVQIPVSSQLGPGLNAWFPPKDQNDKFFGVARIYDPDEILMNDFLTHCKQITEEKK